MATILLLDDDAAFRKSTEAILTAQSHQVVCCGRGEEARRLLASKPFDLLLVDYLLPDIDGVRFVRELRKEGVTTPAVLISHFWKKSDAEVLREGFTAVLHKPVAPATLVARVQRLVGSTGEPLDAVGEGQLDALRAAYARELPVLLDGLHVALMQLQQKPNEIVLRGIVRRRAHHIAGTAGSFGFSAIGDACAQIEGALFAQSGIAWDRIEKALSSLGNAEGPGHAAAS